MRLLQLELKRTLSSRATRCILALALVLSLVMAWLPVSYVRLYSSEGSEITGLQAVQEIKQLAAPYSGEVTAEKVQKALAEYQGAVRQYHGESISWEHASNFHRFGGAAAPL